MKPGRRALIRQILHLAEAAINWSRHLDFSLAEKAWQLGVFRFSNIESAPKGRRRVSLVSQQRSPRHLASVLYSLYDHC